MSENPEEIARKAVAIMLQGAFAEYEHTWHGELVALLATALKEAEARAYERAAKVADSVVALVGSPAFVFVPTTADGVRAAAKDIAEGIRRLSNPESANRENGK